jgi:hypothetical protein
VRPRVVSGATACGPCAAITAVTRSQMMSSASSHDARANRPSPFAPTRLSGVRSRPGPCTQSGYEAATLVQMTPAV